jgi:cell division protein FtsB
MDRSSMEQLQHFWELAYGVRRKLGTWALFLFAGLLAVHVIFGTNGWMAYENKKAEYRKVTEEVQQVKQDNEQIQHNITALKTDPEAIAKQARETLRYTKSGEIVIYLPSSKTEVPATAQARNEPSKK